MTPAPYLLAILPIFGLFGSFLVYGEAETYIFLILSYCRPEARNLFCSRIAVHVVLLARSS